MEYTKQDVMERLSSLNIHVSDVTLNNLINENNFYQRGLGRKESNGYDLGDGYTGKIWKLTEDGVNELISLCQKERTGRGKDTKPRHRRTKAEIEQAKQLELDKQGKSLLQCEIRTDLYKNLISYVTYSNKDLETTLERIIDKEIQEKMDIVNQIRELRKQL